MPSWLDVVFMSACAHAGQADRAYALYTDPERGWRERLRLPLSRLTVAVTDAAALGQFEGILRDELNVKSVELVELTEGLAESYGISQRLAVNARAAGPRLGKQVQHVIAGARAGLPR